jgi:chromosome segregation ATPase
MATLKEVEQQLRKAKKELREVREEAKEKDIVIKTLTERLSARTEEKSEWIKKYNEKSIDDCVAQNKAQAEYFEKYKKDKELIEAFDKQSQVKLGELGA